MTSEQRVGPTVATVLWLKIHTLNCRQTVYLLDTEAQRISTHVWPTTIKNHYYIVRYGVDGMVVVQNNERENW